MPSLGPMGRGGARRRTRRRMSRRQAMQEQTREEQQPHAAAPQETAAPAASQEEQPAYLGELEKLGELRDKGVITAEDFEAKKKQLLGI